MNVSNSKIEIRALNALENIIDAHNTMSHQFNSLDKEMSWDGSILIFKDNAGDTNKANLDDEVRVQIKGHIDDPVRNQSRKRDYLGRQRITYPVELVDLKIYSKGGGVIYFEIFMSPDGKEREVFYASLYPSVLKKYIDEKERKLAKKKAQPKKPTIIIVFSRLENNEDVLYKIVKQFSIEKGKQGTGEVALVKDMIMLKDMDKVKSISVTAVGIDDEFGLLKRFAAGDICFYGKTEGNPYERPIEWAKDAKFIMRKGVEKSISIGDMLYYEKYEVEETSDGELAVIPSPNLRFDLSNGRFNFRSSTGIKELKHDAEFLLAAMGATAFKINNTNFSYMNPAMPKELEDELKFYLDIDEVLSMIGLDFDKPLKDAEGIMLRQLADLLCMKKGLKNSLLTEKFHTYNWMLGDKYVPVIVIRHDKDEENDLFNAIYTKNLQTMASDGEGNYFKIPLFEHVDMDIIKKLYRYDYEWLKKQIDEEDVNEYTAEYLNQAALKLISIFDENKDYKALELAQYQFDKIKKLEKDKPYFIINVLQLKKRREGLTERDIQELRKIATASDPQICFGANVLLGNKDRAKQEFEKVDGETQRFIKICPIYYLYELYYKSGHKECIGEVMSPDMSRKDDNYEES